MNKFLGTLIVQNILLIYLILFIPIYLYLKPLTDLVNYEMLFLIIYVIVVIIISYLNTYLLNDPDLSFGFLRFVPFFLLLMKLNKVLKRDYPGLSLSYFQKYIMIIHLMNRHAVLTEEEYTYFSRLMRPTTDDPEYEFSVFIETPFWYELQPGLDHYALRRELFSEKGLQFSEKSFAMRFFLLVILYLLVVALIYFHVFFF